MLKPDLLLVTPDQRLDIIQSELTTSLQHIVEAAGRAQKNLIQVLKRSWMCNPYHHQTGVKREAKFQAGDIVIYIMDNEAKLARITKVNGNFSNIMIADKSLKTKMKNIHDRFLLLLVRQHPIRENNLQVSSQEHHDTTGNLENSNPSRYSTVSSSVEQFGHLVLSSRF